MLNHTTDRWTTWLEDQCTVRDLLVSLPGTGTGVGSLLTWGTMSYRIKLRTLSRSRTGGEVELEHPFERLGGRWREGKKGGNRILDQ